MSVCWKHKIKLKTKMWFETKDGKQQREKEHK